MKHPLVHCGKPDKAFGMLTDYISDAFKDHLPYGFEIYDYEKTIALDKILDAYSLCETKDTKETKETKKYVQELFIPSRLSNCVFIDASFQKSPSVCKEFAHWRTQIPSHAFQMIFDKTIQCIAFKKSNASRVFTNFLTNDANYTIMNKIARDACSYVQPISQATEMALKILRENITDTSKILGLHLRFGDYHKTPKQIHEMNDIIEKNIIPWIEKYPHVLVMTDRRDNTFFTKFTDKIIFADDLITPEIKTFLSQSLCAHIPRVRKTEIAEFLVQKNVCSTADVFIGTAGSTVSSHIQYTNFLKHKPFEKYAHIGCGKFDTNTLELARTKPNTQFTWTQKNFLGGHPVSWNIFFEDNEER